MVWCFIKREYLLGHQVHFWSNLKNKQYVKIKLVQNETNRWGIFSKDEILVKHWFKGLNYHNFTFFIIINFKTDRYLNTFQEHLFGIPRLRKYQTSLQKISFLRENEAVKHNLVEFKVQCLKVFCYHGNKSTILLFNSIFGTTPEVSNKHYFVEIS